MFLNDDNDCINLIIFIQRYAGRYTYTEYRRKQENNKKTLQ